MKYFYFECATHPELDGVHIGFHDDGSINLALDDQTAITLSPEDQLRLGIALINNVKNKSEGTGNDV